MRGAVVPSNTGKAPDQELIEMQRALLSGPTTGVPATGDPDARKAYLGRRAAQREAYGQFVATEHIYDPDGSALIFVPGSAVPIEHVERFGLEDLGMVERVASPELARRGMRFERKDADQSQQGEPRTIGDSIDDSAGAVDASADSTAADNQSAGRRRTGK